MAGTENSIFGYLLINAVGKIMFMQAEHFLLPSCN